MQIHSIDPVYDENSRILILGSFPSVRSRETGFFYGHAQNRFWKVLAGIFEANTPETVSEKIVFLKEHRIALWDVVGACDIVGSSDASIKNAQPNDISMILRHANIQKIFLNGACAKKYYIKLLEKNVGVGYECLPSTSAANATYTIERLCDRWKIVADYVNKCENSSF